MVRNFAEVRNLAWHRFLYLAYQEGSSPHVPPQVTPLGVG